MGYEKWPSAKVMLNGDNPAANYKQELPSCSNVKPMKRLF